MNVIMNGKEINMDIKLAKKELTLQEIKILAYYVYVYAALNTSSGQYFVYPEELASRTGISQKSIAENAERILEVMDIYFADELLEPAVWNGESFDVNLGLNYCMYIDYEDSSNKEFSPGASALEEASMLQVSMGFSDEQMLQIRPLIFEGIDYGELLSVYNSTMEMFDVRKRIERVHYWHSQESQSTREIFMISSESRKFTQENILPQDEQQEQVKQIAENVQRKRHRH